MNTKVTARPQNHYLIFAILVLALAIRVVYLTDYYKLPDWDQLTVDNNYHHHWAESIADGNIAGDTTYFRAPFYVYCLGLLYSILGTSLWVGRIFGLVVGLLSIGMTYLIARRIFNVGVALIAATIQTLYPLVIYTESELLLDPLFTLLLQAAIYHTLVWWDTASLKRIFMAGLFLGLAAITRPTALIFVPPAFVLIVVVTKRLSASVAPCGLFAAGVALIVLPIFVRNVVVAKDPVLIASQGGINLYIGNNSAADGISATLPEPLGLNWRIEDITYIAEKESGKTLRPGEVSSYWTRQAKNWILDNPLRFLSLTAEKLYRSFADREISNNRNLAAFFAKIPLLKYNPLSFGPILALAIVGLFIGAWKNPRAAVLSIMILSYVVASSLFFFASRFRLPLLPLYFILASYALWDLKQRFTQKPRSVIMPLIAAVTIGFLSRYPFVGLPPGGNSQPLTSTGLYYSATGNYPLALEYFRQARALEPAFPEANLNLGTAFFRMGLADSALVYFHQEIACHPQRVKAQTNIASMYLLNGDYRKALEEIRQPLRTRPYDLTANRVFVRAILEDTLITSREQLRQILEAADRTYDNIFLLNDAGVILTQQGDLDAARTVLARAVTSNPPPIETDDEAFEHNFPNSAANWRKEKAQAFYQLGFVNGVSGDFSPAVMHSRRAIELDSNLAEAYVNLVSGYFSMGQTEQARQVLSLASKRFPHDDRIRQLQQQLDQ